MLIQFIDFLAVKMLPPKCPLFFFAFAGNAALRLVEIPASVTAIDATAFAGCSEALVIVTEAGSAADAFARMNGLPLVSR